ncbi:YolD-like family protein [Anaerobacillus sp. MEB173]|uniref:YolD-like family protein n=1 Tax=Anaerobacillus sp. MEB173 TaxID=3383345 RepID=UPI003F8DBD95
MILRKLTKNHLITVSYCKDGMLHSCRGHVYNLDLINQTLSLKDENSQINTILLPSIKEIE